MSFLDAVLPLAVTSPMRSVQLLASKGDFHCTRYLPLLTALHVITTSVLTKVSGRIVGAGAVTVKVPLA